ncbi:VWA domain-containing protein [Acidobacteria bacterium AH-259-D05]|nr:VWA domain-containing protein [Acidobacteria bacterium AH-259-D05]
MKTMRCVACGFLFLLVLLTVDSAVGQKDLPPRFRIGVDTVAVRITVTDPLNRYVVGLEKEHFKIFENKVQQTITHFFNSKSAISVGLILDVSGSMKDKIVSAHSSVVRFLEGGDEGDQYFLITFNDRSTIVQDFTSASKNMQNQVSISIPKGRTALYDAVYLGLEKLRQSQQSKKALIIITDGEDNSSRYTFSEVKEFVKESDVQIYVIGERSELGYGRGIIAQIGQLTGGRAFFPHSFKQLDYFVDLIHAELRHQYVLGYIPMDRDFRGEWRKIKVRLEPPEGLPKLIVRAKEGYYTPKKFTN